MKLMELRLLAFGPFTDTVLSLAGGSEGLHIIYGPNEAGKSSALRAVESLLFGIDNRTNDDFLHNYESMRIGGILKRRDGQQLDFVRRKAHKHPLRDRSDTSVIDDSELVPYLRGLDRNSFRTMFGLNHDTLVQGGREVVQGKGKVGELLFSAGAGIANVRQTVLAFKSEADSLFAPRARKLKLNHAIAQVENTRKQIKSIHAESANWLKLDQERQDTEKAGEEARKLLHELEQRQRRLERLREGIPLVAQHASLKQEWTQYKDVRLLDTDFRDQRRSAEASLDSAQRELREIEAEIESLSRTIETPVANAILVEHTELIDSLIEQLGSHRKAIKDRPGIDREVQMLGEEARRIARELHPDVDIEQADRLRLPRAEAARIEDLASQYDAIAAAIDHAADGLQQLHCTVDGITRKRSQLEAPRDITNLQRILKSLEREGDLDDRFQELDREWNNEHADIARRIQFARVWQGTPEQLGQLPLPTIQAVEEIERLRDSKREQLERWKTEIVQLHNRIGDLQSQLRSLVEGACVPTEDDLAAARQLREQGLGLLKRLIQDGVLPDEAGPFIATQPGSHTLLEAFERTIRSADELADRLRREADSVARRVSTEAELEQRRQELNRIEQSLQNVVDEAQEIEERWNELWAPCGIHPRSPREMKEWLRESLSLVERVARCRRLREQADELAIRMEQMRQQLAAALSEFSIPEPSTLADAHAISAKLVEETVEREREFQVLDRQLAERLQDLHQAEAKHDRERAKLDEWQTHWSRAMQQLRLDENALPAEARSVVRSMQELASRIDERKKAIARIDGIDRDARDFKARVEEACTSLAQDLLQTPPDIAVTQLSTRRKHAEQELTRKEEQNIRRQQSRAKRTQLLQSIEHAEATLHRLCQEANCDDPCRLADCEERSEHRRQLERELAAIEKQILPIAAGSSLEEFAREVHEVQADAVETDLKRTSEAIEELRAEKSRLDVRFGELREKLANLDGNDKAAELGEAMQSDFGEIRRLSEQYIRARLAERLLEEAIDRYRRENQGPLLHHAGDIFQHLTVGSFSGLETNYAENGELLLQGKRGRDGKRISVDAMSEGTADQLFLALRLASLESYLDNTENEPVPIILDDVLVNFDNQRSKATLEVLAQLSTRAQVLLFTHHRHLVDLAENCIARDALFVHDLAEAANANSKQKMPLQASSSG